MVLRYDLWLTYSNIYFPNEFPRMGFPIKFEYHWDLFIPRFISPKADAKDIQINAKWKRQMWPQGWTQNQYADGLDQVPSKHRKKRRELNSWNIDSRTEICLYYGIVCHINKRLQIFRWTCSVYTSWFHLIFICTPYFIWFEVPFHAKCFKYSMFKPLN